MVTTVTYLELLNGIPSAGFSHYVDVALKVGYIEIMEKENGNYYIYIYIYIYRF